MQKPKVKIVGIFLAILTMLFLYQNCGQSLNALDSLSSELVLDCSTGLCVDEVETVEGDDNEDDSTSNDSSNSDSSSVSDESQNGNNGEEETVYENVNLFSPKEHSGLSIKMISIDQHFVVLNSLGELYSWGAYEAEATGEELGEYKASVPIIENVLNVYSSSESFLAVEKDRRSIHTWGKNRSGGSCDESFSLESGLEIIQILPSYLGFALMDSRGALHLCFDKYKKLDSFDFPVTKSTKLFKSKRDEYVVKNISDLYYVSSTGIQVFEKVKELKHSGSGLVFRTDDYDLMHINLFFSDYAGIVKIASGASPISYNVFHLLYKDYSTGYLMKSEMLENNSSEAAGKHVVNEVVKNEDIPIEASDFVSEDADILLIKHPVTKHLNAVYTSLFLRGYQELEEKSADGKVLCADANLAVVLDNLESFICGTRGGQVEAVNADAYLEKNGSISIESSEKMYYFAVQNQNKSILRADNQFFLGGSEEMLEFKNAKALALDKFYGPNLYITTGHRIGYTSATNSIVYNNIKSRLHQNTDLSELKQGTIFLSSLGVTSGKTIVILR
ncbi:MAG: hypothetical protein VX642_02630 [Bdellovibrionota bacterium]|nr:hypothetical protein [Bdellovibrionota bacterium]